MYKQTFGIVPETEVEKKIITSREFYEGANFGEPRIGHPEGKVLVHIRGILNTIDKENYPNHREKLRLVALLHDIGKVHTKYSTNGYLIGDPHAIISERIARRFINDESILNVIGKHSKYYSFYRKEQEKRFNDETFKQTFANIDLDLLVRFVYCDLFERDRTPARWFEEKLIDQKLLPEEVSGKLGELEVINYYDHKTIISIITTYGTDHLLDGLVDPRYLDTFEQFINYAKKGRLLYFVKPILTKTDKIELTRKQKEKVSKLQHLASRLEYLRSEAFADELENIPNKQIDTYRNRLMIGIAKDIDAVTEIGGAMRYLIEEGSQVRVNVNGCQVPLNLIEGAPSLEADEPQGPF